jgi:VanZ family protein
MRDFVVWWGPAILWMAVIFYASAQNTWTVIQGPPILQAFRKSAHVWEYALLALLVGWGLVSTWRGRGADFTRTVMRRVWAVGTVLCALYAASDEIHQAFVPRREFHVEDIIVDTLSAFVALGVWYIVFVERRRLGTRARGEAK